MNKRVPRDFDSKCHYERMVAARVSEAMATSERLGRELDEVTARLTELAADLRAGSRGAR